MPCRRVLAGHQKRCHYHGGAKGSGGDGRPPETFLYRRHLPDEQQEVFDRAAVDSLDDEIRLAKANLDSAVQCWSEDPTGGVVKTRGDKSITERLWVDIVREHIETVRRLLEARARINSEGERDTAALDKLMQRIDAGEYEPNGT